MSKTLYDILKSRDSYEYLNDLYLICRSLYYLAGSGVSESIQDRLLFIDSCLDKEKRRIHQQHYKKIKKELFDEKNS